MKRPSAYRNLRKAWKRRSFQRSGMKPWTRGYTEYKAHEIAHVLRQPDFNPDTLPAGFGFRLDERIVEYPWFFSRLPAAPGLLLDAGSVLNFDYLLDLPALKNKRLHICTLAPEDDCFWQKGVSYLYEDLRNLPYRDSLFDWIVCLSTLEHVGMNNSIYTDETAQREGQADDCIRALLELRRVMKPGGKLFLSVPFGKRVNHGWFQTFDQGMIDALIGAFQPASQTLAYFRYHESGWRNSTALDAGDAVGFDIQNAAGYDPDFAAAARGVCCLELRR